MTLKVKCGLIEIRFSFLDFHFLLLGWKSEAETGKWLKACTDHPLKRGEICFSSKLNCDPATQQSIKQKNQEPSSISSPVFINNDDNTVTFSHRDTINYIVRVWAVRKNLHHPHTSVSLSHRLAREGGVTVLSAGRSQPRWTISTLQTRRDNISVRPLPTTDPGLSIRSWA